MEPFIRKAINAPSLLYASEHIDSACKIDALMTPKETLAHNCLFFEDLSASLEVT